MKNADFRGAREKMSGGRNYLDAGPSLGSLRTGTAIGGPCDGAKVQAPPMWDGRVSRGGKDFAGRYAWSFTQNTWVWESK